ncbi:TetR/AcrR family transcriptional regulator [Schaalia suimastitidis]|uniref:TetR/AcrR family transcriptional regulator n=1 Tax=Schaalia suimastitidis TaxID=121163 RepID=UPI0004212D97|nr:TetR/AcrR family transcriptional regulator [Schaalia suimastitidis]
MPKILGQSLSAHRELTRTRLFAALQELMSEKPFDAITMSMIAARAKVGRTAVYNHFADKEVLLLAFMEQTTTEFTQFLKSELAEYTDPVDQLMMYVRAHLEMTDRYHLTAGINLREHVSDNNSQRLHHHADMVGAMLRTIVTQGVDSGRLPQQDVNMSIPLVHAALAGQRLPSTPSARMAAIHAVQIFVLRGLGVADADISASARRIPQPTLVPIDNSAATDAQHTIPDRRTAYMRCPVHH